AFAHAQRLLLHVGKGHALAPRPRMPGRDDDDELVGHQLARQESLRAGRSADDAHLGARLLDPRRDLTARADEEADRDVRILALEPSDQRREHVLARDRGAADDELAGRPPLEPIERLARLALDRFQGRSEEHTSELQSRGHLVCRLLLEKKKQTREYDYSK